MKKSDGLGPTGKYSTEMAIQSSLDQQHFTPFYEKLPPSSGAVKKLPRWSSKSIIKQVATASGEQSVWCDPVSSLTEVKKGQRVLVGRANSIDCGTVRVVNVTIEGKKGFTGVELDLPSMCYVY